MGRGFGLRSWLAAAVIVLPLGIALPSDAADNSQKSRIVEQKSKALDSLLGSPSVEMIDASGDAGARQLLAEARGLAQRAAEDAKNDRIEAADEAVTRALKLISQATIAASKASSSQKKNRDAQAREYLDLMESIRIYRESFMEAARTKGPAAAALLDRGRLDELLIKAEQNRNAGDMTVALSALEEAYALTEAAVVRLRDDETLVYDKTFRTPADEFRYESERYQTYQSLVGQLLERGDGSEQRQAMAIKLKDKAESLFGQATAYLQGGDFQAAVDTLDEATQALVQAAQALGAM